MTVAGHDRPLYDLPAGSHVCWVVDDQAAYSDEATELLAGGGALNQKLVAFGPEGSDSLAAVRAGAAIVADPHVAFLDRGPLTVEAVFAAFREQSAVARDEGYDGLRVVADMDWLLPGRPTPASIVGFELLLDRVVGELGASVVCAYRCASFDAETITGASAVHPIRLGSGEPPQFRMVAGADGTWRLSGEVDVAVIPAFAAAFDAAASGGMCVVDVAGLDFIDVAGMRVVAQRSREHDRTVVLSGASERLRRTWELARFHQAAPRVELLA